MFDSQRSVIVPEWGNYSFKVNGSLLYRGLATVAGGRYQALMPVPKDVSYDNNRARIAVYAWGDTWDAVGFTENVIIAGTDTTAIADSTGPVITIYLQDDSFRSGDVVPPDPQLIVDLQDESGVNTSNVGIGHRLEALVDGEAEPRPLAEYYRGYQDTYQGGRVEYPLRGLSEGRHRLTVKAWDILNNSSQAETFFEIRELSETGVLHVVNVPNPMKTSTIFTFQRISTEPVDVLIKVYSVAGRLLAALEAPSTADRFVQIPWDGRDTDGDRLANGVYLYKVTVRPVDGGHAREALGKLVILR
jgi:hypothetical protein